MVSFNVNRCSSPGCYSRPTYGVPGSVKPEVCVQHKRIDMFNLTGERNLQDEGSTWPSCEMRERLKAEIIKQKGIRYSFQSSPASVHIGRVATSVAALMPKLSSGSRRPPTHHWVVKHFSLTIAVLEISGTHRFILADYAPYSTRGLPHQI